MILVDTSVWIDHLRVGDEGLVTLLDSAQVLCHPFVVGELACGNLRNRGEALTLFGELPRVAVATDAEVLYFIEQHGLMGRGIGYIDAHLLAAVSLAGPARLWTRDKRLGAVATDLGLAYETR
jgi:predicted nucleic acid-binding protein